PRFARSLAGEGAERTHHPHGLIDEIRETRLLFILSSPRPSLSHYMAFLPPYFIALIAGACLLALLRLAFNSAAHLLLDPDAGLPAIDLIRRWGYPAEAHDVITADGYVLELQRIPRGKDDDQWSDSSPRPAILLMHGLHGSSLNWIMNLPEQSAAFIFADAGYDVWLGNCRGNIYGQRHTHIDPASRAFWDFTWEDMADHDVPATVDYILNATGHSSLHYVGHSQGFAIITAHLASHERFAEKISGVFGVAPVWTNGYSWGPAVVLSYKRPYYEFIIKHFGSTQYHAKTTTFLSTMAKYACVLPGVNYGCGILLEAFGGMPTLQINYTRTAVYMASIPAGSSTKNCVHWAQICHRKKNLRYDYGEAKNVEKYGQLSPPSFDVSRIRTPLHLFWSREDWLADDTDIRLFLDQVDPAIIKSAEIIPGFNHFDFIFGKDAGDRVYRHILNRIAEGGTNHVDYVPHRAVDYCTRDEHCTVGYSTPEDTVAVSSEYGSERARFEASIFTLTNSSLLCY
ncbi:hypothetical protein PENTCL1PPCAC_3578, partial [Pristionchus entomophagus]